MTVNYEGMVFFMTFAASIKEVMVQKNLTITKISELSGIGKSSISQYVSGKNEPSDQRKRVLAKAMGLPDDWPAGSSTDEIKQQPEANGFNVKKAAHLMGKSYEFVYQGLRDGVFPWGYAVKMKSGKYTYWISADLFTQYTGIQVPA